MKRSTQKRYLLIAVIQLVILVGCQSDEKMIMSNSMRREGIATTIGKRLDNPYSLSNMRKAYDNIKNDFKGGRIKEDFEINATHKYIRFLPANFALYDTLVSDTTIHFVDHPIEVEVISYGDYYHDPSVPDTLPTWQYAAIPIGHNVPAIVYQEQIDELYLPQEDTSFMSSNGRIAIEYESFIEALEDEALRITGNLETAQKNGRTKGGKWYPGGRIMLFDDRLNTAMPVRGAKVQARRWFTTHEAFTDANGNFKMNDHFRHDANYSIKWERADYDIRSGTFGQAIYNGPKQEGDWNLTINSGLSRMYAIVHQAAHDYYYGNRLGLKSPPRNSFWKASIKIAVYNHSDDSNGSHCKDCRAFGALPWLKIWNNGGTCEQVYATTIHELAHASHWELRRNNWSDNNTEERVKESWARGVQWALGRLRYPNYVGGATIRPSYTQLVVDMIDPNYASALTNENNGLWNDNVTGYSIKQIEDVLGSTSNWQDWENHIRNTYNNATENNLQALFSHWN
jgi:hypothetical protein